MLYIPDEEYTLTGKDVVKICNSDYGNVFNTVVTSNEIGRWTSNYEINAIKNERNRWCYRLRDIEDFVYRYRNKMVHSFNSSYHTRTRVNIYRDLLHEFYQEENTFYNVVCTIVTLHPYALYNDPERRHHSLHRAEGGIIFKDAAVHFGLYSVGPKDTALSIRKQRLLYPVIVASTINKLGEKYLETKSGAIKDSLIEAGWEMVNNRIPREQYLHEISEYHFYAWEGLIHDYGTVTGKKKIFVEVDE